MFTGLASSAGIQASCQPVVAQSAQIWLLIRASTVTLQDLWQRQASAQAISPAAGRAAMSAIQAVFGPNPCGLLQADSWHMHRKAAVASTRMHSFAECTCHACFGFCFGEADLKLHGRVVCATLTHSYCSSENKLEECTGCIWPV